MRLALDKMADRGQHRPFERLLPLERRSPVRRISEGVEINSVAQDRNPLSRDAQLGEVAGQRIADRDQPVGALGRAAYERTRQSVPRNEVEIGAASRDRQRQAEIARKPGGDDSVGIEIMRVDKVEALAAFQQLPNFAAQGRVKEDGRRRHPDLGNDGKARVQDADAVALLLLRRAGEIAVAGGASQRLRHPGDRRNHLRLVAAAFEEMAQPVLDEDAMVRPLGIGVERGEDEQSHGRVAKASSYSLR